jgi:predicted transcriptional regulator
MTATRTLTVEISEEQALRLERLAERDERDAGAIAADALQRFLDELEREAEAVEEGLEDLRSGRVVDHEQVAAWLRSWGTSSEREPPA